MADTRFRISAKQTAKNLWQIDATCENVASEIQKPGPAEDMGAETRTHLAKELLNLVNETIKEFRQDGKKIVGDAG